MTSPNQQLPGGNAIDTVMDDEAEYSSDDDETPSGRPQFDRIIAIMRYADQILLRFMANLPAVDGYDNQVANMIQSILTYQQNHGGTFPQGFFPLVITNGTDWPALAVAMRDGKAVNKGEQKPTVYEFDFCIWPGATIRRVPFRGRQLRRPDYSEGLSWPAIADGLHNLAIGLGGTIAPGATVEVQERVGVRALATAILYIIQGRGAEVLAFLRSHSSLRLGEFERYFELTVVEFLSLAMGIEVIRLPYALLDLLLHMSNIANGRGFGPSDKPYTFLNVFSSIRDTDEGERVHTYLTGVYDKKGGEHTEYGGFSTQPAWQHTDKYDDEGYRKSAKSVGKSVFSHSAGHIRLEKLFAGDKETIERLWQQVRPVGRNESRDELHTDRIYDMSPLRAYNLFANLLSTYDNDTLAPKTVAAHLIQRIRIFLQGARCGSQNMFCQYLATANLAQFSCAVLDIQLAEHAIDVDITFHMNASDAMRENSPEKLLALADHNPVAMFMSIVKFLSHEPTKDRDPLIHFAVRTKKIDLVRAVLAAGGDPFAVDRQGRTVLGVALELWQSDIAKLLIEAQDHQRDPYSTVLPKAWKLYSRPVGGEWLTDDEVNKLLANAGLPNDTYIAPAVDVAGYPDALATFIRDNYRTQHHQQGSVSAYTVIPINFHNAHWATLVIVQNPHDRSNPTVYFFDSLGGSDDKRLLIKRVLQMTGIYVSPALDIIDLSQHLQHDSISCGSWMVVAATIIVQLVQRGANPQQIAKALAEQAKTMGNTHLENLKKFGR